MSVYRVVGTHGYREHEPGQIFHANLDRDAERRAVARGNIVVLDSSPTRLRPGSYRLPDGWHETHGAADAALSIEGSNR
jgi:hypothetical protein